MKHEYGWRFSFDGGETFDRDTYATFDDAKEAALFHMDESDNYAVIAECLTQDYNLTVPQELIWEYFDRNNERRLEDYEYTHDAIGASDIQLMELTDSINAIISAWVTKHNFDTTAFLFANIRNVTEVKRDSPDEGGKEPAL